MKANFQLITLIGFMVLAVFGVLVFSGAIPIGSTTKTTGSGVVVLWGTASATAVSPVLEEFNQANQSFSVQYVQKDPNTFGQDLLEALAAGVGPDMFFMPDTLAYSYKNKIFTIPYTSYSKSTFKNTFAGAGEVFMTNTGILAFPIAVDPMVMYYNRSMLDANNIIYPPAYWDQFSGLVPVLTKKDDSNRIIKSTVAFGQFTNITHAKDVLATLFMQTGNPIISQQAEGNYVSALDQAVGAYGLETVLQFYTDFANPVKDVYSWNRGLPVSRDFFSADDLAFYFGYGSELQSLVNKNPNLNFLVAPMPQVRGANFKLTSGHVLGIAVSSFSRNFNTAFTAASLMANGPAAGKLALSLGMVPVRRDLLTAKPTDAFYPTFYSSALYARSWLDPSSNDTDDIFRNMIEKVLSNTLSYVDGVRDASSKMSLLLNR